jgi:hypothetical protein
MRITGDLILNSTLNYLRDLIFVIKPEPFQYSLVNWLTFISLMLPDTHYFNKAHFNLYGSLTFAPSDCFIFCIFLFLQNFSQPI